MRRNKLRGDGGGRMGRARSVGKNREEGGIGGGLKYVGNDASNRAGKQESGEELELKMSDSQIGTSENQIRMDQLNDALSLHPTIHPSFVDPSS
jgi:hypothetical protein